MHGYQWAEVAPAAPAFAELIPPLLILCGLIFALGCVTLIRGFVNGVFGIIEATIGHIPGVGGLVGGALTRAEQSISNALGSAITGIDARIATQFHNLANAIVSLWHHLETSAVNLYDLAKLVAGAATFPDVHSIERDLRKLIRGVESEAARALHRIHHLEGTITQTIPRNLTRRLHAVEHAISTTIPREIKSARDLAREAEDGVTRLWDRVRALEAGVGAGAIAAAIAAALAALGLDWFRCNNATKTLARGCTGLWGDIEGLLGLFADTILLTNICTLLPLLETAVSEVADPLVIALTDVGAGLCSGGIGPAPALAVPVLSTAAAPDDTLYLP